MRMSYWIKRIYKGGRNFRLNIPLELIREKGWDNALYVRVEGQWGNRIMLTKVGDDEEITEENTRASLRRD